jgi:hypothetical protein
MLKIFCSEYSSGLLLDLVLRSYKSLLAYSIDPRMAHLHSNSIFSSKIIERCPPMHLCIKYFALNIPFGLLLDLVLRSYKFLWAYTRSKNGLPHSNSIALHIRRSQMICRYRRFCTADFFILFQFLGKVLKRITKYCKYVLYYSVPNGKIFTLRNETV